MSVLTGSSAVQEQPPILTFTPGAGHRTTRVFKGPTSAILAQYYAAAAAGYTCVLRTGFGGVDVLEASTGGDGSGGGTPVETPTEVWTLHGNDVEKDILESDLAIMETISDDDKRTIRKAIDSADGVDPELAGAAATVYGLMLNGARSVRVFQPVLSGSYLATARYAQTRSATNVGKLFTNAQLINLEGAPGNLLVQLPSSAASTRGDISVVYRWLKKYPTVEQSGADLLRVSVEFEFGLWATTLYSNAS